MQVPLLKHLALCSEGALCPVGISGFDSMRALSRRSEKPELASCPWDKKRDGFVMSDGAGILVLEEYNHAKNRGAKIYGEILGFGLSGDVAKAQNCSKHSDRWRSVRRPLACWWTQWS